MREDFDNYPLAELQDSLQYLKDIKERLMKLSAMVDKNIPNWETRLSTQEDLLKCWFNLDDFKWSIEKALEHKLTPLTVVQSSD